MALTMFSSKLMVLFSATPYVWPSIVISGGLTTICDNWYSDGEDDDDVLPISEVALSCVANCDLLTVNCESLQVVT